MIKRFSTLTLAVLFVVFFFAVEPGAQETKPETSPETKPPMTVEDIQKSLEEIKNYLGLSIYVQGGYTYNFSNPDSGKNQQRIFDQEANSFLLDLAQIQFAKDAPVGGVGYKFKVSFGETAKYIHSAGLGDPGESVDLTEAYVDYRAPLGNGLGLRFGKFVTYLGAEVIEARTISTIRAPSSSTTLSPSHTQGPWPNIHSPKPSLPVFIL